jgi:DNA replication protein DnaC
LLQESSLGQHRDAVTRDNSFIAGNRDGFSDLFDPLVQIVDRVGKSFVASALAQKACRDGYTAYYARAAAMFRDLEIARADGSFRSLLVRLSRIDVLVIDDWAMAPMKESERRDFWEICEDRYQVRSMILTSQMPVSKWHEQIGDPTVADGILDRIVHNAHRIEMRGDSMRRKRKGEEPADKSPAGGA